MRDERGERAGQGLHPWRVTQGESGLDGFHNHHLHQLITHKMTTWSKLIFPIPGLPHNPSGVIQGRVLYKLHTPVSRINVLKDCLRIPFAFAKTAKNQRQWNNNCFHWQECKSDAKEGQDGLLKAKEANRANEARGNFFRWPMIHFILMKHLTRYVPRIVVVLVYGF